jgi:hypothetical protein
MHLEQVNVGFKNFWPGFNPQDFFVPFISASLDCEVLVTKCSKADIIFTSVFPNNTLTRRILRRLSVELGISKLWSKRSRKRFQKLVWFTGENVRPPFEGFDLTYSFDVDSYGGSNVYLPLFNLSLDWFQDGQIERGLEAIRSGRVVTPTNASFPRQTDITERKYFACAFIGNPEPLRLRALAALESLGQVDVFGNAVGRPVPNKHEIAKDYKFMLCFENDLYPGYVTEKALEAWVSGCIPLWRGIDQSRILNPKAMLNANDFETLDDFIQEVARLRDSPSELKKMSSEPLFSYEPSLLNAAEALRNLFI